jgi:catecholate siderophore receptor
VAQAPAFSCFDKRALDQLGLCVPCQDSHTDRYHGNILARRTVSAADTVGLAGYDSATLRDSWVGQANLVWTGQTGGIGRTLLAGVEAADQDGFARRRNTNSATAAAYRQRIPTTISRPAHR